MTQTKYITDDLAAMLNVFPEEIAAAVRKADHFDNLLEVILDLGGRVPTARFVEGEVALLERVVEQKDIDHVVGLISDFDADNRAGMERTLHRISAIRNRRGEVVGLTCRIGRRLWHHQHYRRPDRFRSEHFDPGQARRGENDHAA